MSLTGTFHDLPRYPHCGLLHGTANLSYAVPGLLLCTGACPLHLRVIARVGQARFARSPSTRYIKKRASSLHKKPFITPLQCPKTFQALAFQALARKTFHASAAFHVITS